MSTNDVTGSWLAASVRVTVFVPLETEFTDTTSWQSLLGNLPDEISGSPKLGTYEASGMFNAGLLALKQEPGRIELTHHAVISVDLDSLREFPNLGSFDEVKAEFAQIAMRLLEALSSGGIAVARLAFGAELIQPVPNHEAGYVKLDSLLPEVSIDPNSADFIYGVNRKRPSITQENLYVNRLSRWTVRRILAKNAADKVVTDLYACHLILDINSIPEDGLVLEPGLLCNLMSEFIGLGTEIAEHGDIP